MPRSTDLGFPLLLVRRRTFILPTAQGFLFMIVLGAMLLGALNEHNNLGLMMTFLLGGILLVSLFHTHANLAGLEILSSGAGPVFAGERAVFDLRIRSGAATRRAVAFSLAGKKPVWTDLPAHGDISVKLEVATHRRGQLAAGDLTIWTRFPLGLFRAWSRVRLPGACLVYPKPVAAPMDKVPADDPGEPGADQAGQRAGVDDFQGLRAYQPGDPPQHIAWKAFSRGQGLLTKEFVGSGGGNVILDWRRVRDKDPERRLSIICHHVLAAERSGTPYGLRLASEMIAPGLGPAHRHRCLKTLALAGEAQ